VSCINRLLTARLNHSPIIFIFLSTGVWQNNVNAPATIQISLLMQYWTTFCFQYCHVFGVPWLIMGSGFVDWVYWHFFTIITAHNQWLSTTRSFPYWTTSVFSSTVTNDKSLLTHWTLLLSLSLMLRPTVSRSVGLGIKHPSGAYDQIFITVGQLRVCWWGALSLTRGRVCRLQLLLALASAVILESEPLGTRDHILLSQIWDFPFRRLLRLFYNF
jgi:hypothetical protein